MSRTAVRVARRSVAPFRGFPGVPLLDPFTSGPSQGLSARAGWDTDFPFPGEADFTTDSTPTTAVSTSSSGNLWGTPFTNCVVWVPLATVGGEIDLYSRWSGSSTRNGYSLITFPGNFYLVKVAAGSNTTISSVSTQSLSAGDAIGLRTVGTTIQGWYRSGSGAWQMLVSATDATYTGSGKIGVDSFSASTALAGFGGGGS